MNKIDRKFGQLRQWTAEKAGKAQKTDLDDEFKSLEQMTESKKEALELLSGELKLMMPYFYRPLNLPIGLGGVKKDKTIYSSVGSAMITAGSGMTSESAYGDALIKCGETLEQVSLNEIDLERSIRDSLYQPMVTLLDGDIKEWQHVRKKLEGRRLDYDGKVTKLSKAKKEEEKRELENEVETMRARFEEVNVQCKDIMTSLVTGKEDEDLENLAAFVEAQRAFFEKGLEAFNKLAATLTDRSVKATRRNSAAMAASPASSEHVASSDTLLDDSLSTGGARKSPIPGGTLSPEATPTPSPASRPVSTHAEPAKFMPGSDDTDTIICVALYSFTSDSSEELSFEKGDVIKVIRKIDDGWWIGELNGRVGMFPTPYVQVEQ